MVELVRQNLNVNKRLYNKIKRQLRDAIGKESPIEHVGSTAIPNMYGKNIIDILVGAKDKNEFESLIEKILALGFFMGKSREENYRFFASTEEETKSGDVHIHLSIIGSDRYECSLILRDYLLANKAEAKKYSNLKKSLLKKGIANRDDYKATKSPYVSQLILRAKQTANKKLC